jgi:hypothetical protein
MLNKYVQEKRPVSYSEAVSAVYEMYGLSHSRSFKRWGDKNNFYINYIPVLNNMYPESQFVHIIRDGRDVACSYINLNKKPTNSKYTPKLPDTIEEIARQWQKNINTINDAISRFSKRRVYEIRYEDLISNPENSLKSLCNFLNEEYDPEMLNYHLNNVKHELEPKEFLQWKENTLKPLLLTGSKKYKIQLGSKEIEAFENLAREALQRYDYL